MPLRLSGNINNARIIALALCVMLGAGCAKELPKDGFHPWNSYMNDTARTNRSPDEVKLPLALIWAKDISEFRFIHAFPKEQLSSPVISDGVLYAGSVNDIFYSLDLATGKSRWEYKAGSPLEAPPAVSGDHVCFGSANGILRCFDRKTGHELWRFQARSEILSSPVIESGMVIFSSSDDRVNAVSLKTGEKLWTYNRTNFQTVTPRLYASSTYANGRVFHLFSDGYLAGIDQATGRELWARRVIKDFDSNREARRTPLADGDTVYMIDDAGAVLAIDAATGEVRRTNDIIKARDFVLDGQRGLIAAGTDQIVSIDRLTGAINWKKDLAHSPVSSIFSSGETLFVLSNYKKKAWIDLFSKTMGHIEAVRTSDGKTAWAQDLLSTVGSNGAAAYSRVAVLTNEGLLEVLGNK